MEQNEAQAAAVRRPFKERLENYWYHFKWHTLIVIFIITVITVCTVQMCSKRSYDVYIMYVGEHSVDMKGTDGDTSEYEKMLSALERYSDDYNEDGETNIELETLYVPSSAEIAEMENSDVYVNYAAIKDNTGVFEDNMLHSTYYLCFISYDLYEKYAKEGAFLPLTDYCTEGKNYEWADECGIYLSSLPSYEREGLRNLPADTVVCLRRIGAISNVFDRGQHKDAHAAAEDVLRNLLK